jgi:hypothetical protein
MTTKELIAFLNTLTSGRILQDHDISYIEAVKQNLQSRLTAGRPKIHESDQARYAFHNARRREMRLQKKLASAT